MIKMPWINSATVSNSKKQTHAKDTERKESSELLTKGIEVDQKNPKDISLGAWLNYGGNYRENSERMEIFINNRHSALNMVIFSCQLDKQVEVYNLNKAK